MTKLPHISTLALAFVLAIVAFVLCADAAHAVANGASESFSCSGGSANGQLYDSGNSCPTTLKMSNVFSFLICNMEQLSSNLMGHMYCGMMAQLTPAVWATATIAVLFFGIAFTFGIVPATGRDATIFLLKIAFVTSFATNADLLIGVGYKLLMSGMQDGVTIVLSALGDEYRTGDSVYGALDGFLATIMHYATDSLSSSITSADPNSTAAAQAVGDARCKNALFAVIATMLTIFPIFGYLIIMLLARVAITFLRAVFGYVYALVGITFLLTMAPIFIPFYLFKPTRSFFDKWIAYMVSFTLQVVLLFAFLAFILSIDTKNMVSNVSDAIMFKAQTAETTAFRFPWEYCTLCDFKIVDRNNEATTLTAQSPNFIRDGKLACNIYPIDPKTTDSRGRKAIDATSAFAPKPGSANSELSSLLMLGTHGVLALVLLAFIVEQLLGMLPRLAQTLTRGMGAAYAPALGGGAGSSMRLPFEAQIGDFGQGFAYGTGAYDANGNPNLLPIKDKGVVQGIKDGFAVMITGKPTDNQTLATSERDANRNPVQPGLGARLPILGMPKTGSTASGGNASGRTKDVARDGIKEPPAAPPPNKDNAN